LIELSKGTFDGEEFIFEKLSDERPGRKPADIIFVARYKKHPIFDVDGCDLLHEAMITESEAKSRVNLEIPTLDSETIEWSGKGIKIFDDCQSFPGKGLPYPDKENKRGDLYLHFKIVNSEKKGDKNGCFSD